MVVKERNEKLISVYLLSVNLTISSKFKKEWNEFSSCFLGVVDYDNN
jgi:hypothetical protein